MLSGQQDVEAMGRSHSKTENLNAYGKQLNQNESTSIMNESPKLQD